MDAVAGRSLIWVLACAGAPDEAPPVTLERAADENVFASTEALGPYTMEATVRVEDELPGAPAQVGEQAVSLRWKDENRWAFTMSRDGRPTSETVVYDGVAWHAEGKGPLTREGDPEPFRVQLAQTWDPWLLAFESVRDQLRLDAGEVGTWEGRRAVPHTIAVVPVPPKARRAWKVESATGEVWLDELTALRVKADVSVRATSGARVRTTHLQLNVTGIGVEPVVAAPGGS